MTTASAPAASIEPGDPFIRHTKNKIASLSNKNKEMLDDLSKLSQNTSQALTAINMIPPHLNNSEKDIDKLFDGLKFKSRRNSFQQSSSIPRIDLSSNNSSLYVLGVDDELRNGTETILEEEEEQETISTGRNSLKPDTIRYKGSKSDFNYNSGELDWKYLSAETNHSDSENANNENLNNDDNNIGVNNVEERDSIGRFCNSKVHPHLTINTKPVQEANRRLITPESSDSEFDLSSAHIALSPEIFHNKNSGRIRPRSMSESRATVGNIRRDRSSTMAFSSLDEVDEEDNSALSPEILDSSSKTLNRYNENEKRPLIKPLVLTNGRNRNSAQRFLDDYNLGENYRSNKFHRRAIDDSLCPSGDIADDNSSIRSENSLLEELGALKNRVKKLEAEHAEQRASVIIDDGDRRRDRQSNTEMLVSPGVSSQGVPSPTTTNSSRNSFIPSVQHQKHLQNAFDFFEKSFNTIPNQPNDDDSSPSPSHSMAMVVSAAQQLNHKLRSLSSQNEMNNGQFTERTIKELLKTSDEQIRSLTECLLALPTLIPKPSPHPSSHPFSSTTQTRKPVYEHNQYSSLHKQNLNDTVSHLGIQTNNNVRNGRSISPNNNQRSGQLTHDSNINMEHSIQRTSNDQSSPPNSYYGIAHNSRQTNKNSQPPSPRLGPDSLQISATSRTQDYRERRRRFSGGSHGSHGSFSGTLPSSSPSPPPQATPSSQISHHNDQQHQAPSNSKSFIDRERRFAHRYSLSSSSTASNGYNNHSNSNSTVSSPTTTTIPTRIGTRFSSSTIARNNEDSSSHPLPRPYTTRTFSEDSHSGISGRTQTQIRNYDHTRRYQFDGAHGPSERSFERRTLNHSNNSNSSGVENDYSHSHFETSASQDLKRTASHSKRRDTSPENEAKFEAENGGEDVVVENGITTNTAENNNNGYS
ncbi:7052_t:CDS:2 [Ambispora gerdemannii]|uniref:7052_t:CDS:1 n=1 Tax=Ambispora gerdemannii TaxID=144530 RepID=A0A9N8Z5L6_9GLOM|nr:7052_t:CDS:2 [Ambispora gerdemannii]